MARPLPFSYRITLQGSFSWPRALIKPPQPCEMLILPPERAPRAWQEQVQKSPTTNNCSTCQGSRVVGKDVTLAWAPRPLPRQPPPPPKVPPERRTGTSGKSTNLDLFQKIGMGSESGGVQNEVLACGGGRRAPRIRPPPLCVRRLRHIMKTTCTSAGGFQSRSALCSTVTGCAGHVQSSPNRASSPFSSCTPITGSAPTEGWSLPGAPGDCSSCVGSLQ